MSKNKLKTAILGLNEKGRLLLEAASQVELLQIEAVADSQTKLAQDTAEQYKCTAYDDYRQVVVQKPFDCLLVADELHCWEPWLKTAIKNKCNILKVSPAARNFGEAAELVRLAEQQGVKFGVVNAMRFSESCLSLRRFCKEPGIGRVFLISVFCAAGVGVLPSWQTDPKLAGGGVLLYEGYELIDQILWNFGMPQQVYCVSTSKAIDRKQRLLATEDTAVITMKFDDAQVGNITVSRIALPDQQGFSMNIYGSARNLMVGKNTFVVNNSTGQTEQMLHYDDDEVRRTASVIENFALSIVSPDNNKLCSSAAENLSNMAVIESAYLSARTGFPEEPAKIMQMTRIEPTDAGLQQVH